MSKSIQNFSCRPESLTLFHYGELDEDDRQRMAIHLQGCAACRRELAQLRSSLEMLPKRELGIPPEEVRAFNERLSRRLRRRHRPLKPALRWSLAGTAAVLLMVMTLHSPAPDLQRPSPGVVQQTGGALEFLPDPELLLNLELLENLDLLQEIEGTGGSG